MNIKAFLLTLVAAAGTALSNVAEPAPEDLRGAVVELDYREAEFCTEIIDESNSGWVSYEQARRNHHGAAEAFKTTPVGIKATRRLFPISARGEGGIYTYRATGAGTGEIDVDMWNQHRADVVRVLVLRFLSPTSAVAEEGVCHGNYVGSVRNIWVTVHPAGAGEKTAPAGELLRLRQELEQKKYTTPMERLYQQRLLVLLQRIAAGEPVSITYAEGNGSTALHLACELSNAELVQWLVEQGADTRARTNNGTTVDDCVCGAQAAAIRAILRKARSK
ncbi:MAG: hypothetical protein IKZ13_09920 [Akkermansia sp.]|nr:hypothetical protein [Akkermansia sp.]